MGTSPPTEAEADRIVASYKVISEPVEWVYSRSRSWMEFRVSVENEGGWLLTLVGKARLAPPHKRSFSLILHHGTNGYRIFSMDVNGNHRNPGKDSNSWNYQTHKQRWTDEHGDAFAFTPVELIPEEPNEAFMEFCRECKISFTGSIGDIPAGGDDGY
ncbi:MAG: hypothetical protein F4X65_07745 [Chloroflexi bacterium]|nr:hypothetical protein [Chloroflexota bacterium]